MIYTAFSSTTDNPWTINKTKVFYLAITTSISALLIMPKPFDCVDHNKLWKIVKKMRIPDYLPASWEIYRQVGKQQLEPGVEEQTGSKLGKEYIKAAYCHPAYLTICRVLHVKRGAGWSTSWNQDGQEKYQRWHHLYGRNWRRTKEPPDESERGEWKNWLKTQHSEN